MRTISRLYETCHPSNIICSRYISFYITILNPTMIFQNFPNNSTYIVFPIYFSLDMTPFYATWKITRSSQAPHTIPFSYHNPILNAAASNIHPISAPNKTSHIACSSDVRIFYMPILNCLFIIVGIGFNSSKESLYIFLHVNINSIYAMIISIYGTSECMLIWTNWSPLIVWCKISPWIIISPIPIQINICCNCNFFPIHCLPTVH